MSDGPATPEHGKATLARGASIGRYVVLGLVGRGGMGEVYAAYDPELDRKVAVKLLRVKPGAGVSLLEGRQRTLREAQAIARLSHPNVVVVYDVGPFEDKVFIAMEFVEGHTAGFWSQSQNRTWRDTLKVYVAAGRGLAAAHGKGLVHRDFKPDNIMVSRDGAVRVMDFGLARQMNERPAADKANGGGEGVTTTQKLPAPLDDPAGAPAATLDGRTLVLTPVAEESSRPSDLEQSNSAVFDQRLTRTGAMMGTPAYMAPEQFRGLAADARTDQFAFCIALYEALYGERPFAGNTLTTLTANVVNGRVREAPADSKVPPWIRRILLRGLRVNADDRFPSMEALIEALGNDPAVARKRAAMGVAAGVGVIAVGLVGFGLREGMADPRQVCSGGPEKLAGIWELLPPGAPESPRQAQLHETFLKSGKSYAKDVWATTSRALTKYARAWTDMYRENCEATVVRKEQSEDVRGLRMECLTERLGGMRALTDVFADANGEVVENAVSASNALASLDRCADVPTLKAVVRPPEDPHTLRDVETLSKRLAEVKALLTAGRWKDALVEAPIVASDAERLGYKPLIAESLALHGNVLLKANDTEAAQRVLMDAFLAAEASRHDEVRAEVAENLVYVLGYQEGRIDDGLRWAKIADAVLQRLGGHDLLRAWLLNDLGAVLQVKGDKDAAFKKWQEAVSIKERSLGRDHPDVGISEGNLAGALAELGRYQEALAHIERSLALLRRGLGSAHPDIAMQMNNRGEILNALSRYAEARAAFEQAREIWARELGSDNSSIAYALTGIGISYLREGNARMAVRPLERAFAIRNAQETEPTRKAETTFALAQALWDATHERERARTLAKDARATYARLALNGRLKQVDEWLQNRAMR